MEKLFEYETFYDEDNSWEALFVYYQGRWRMAQPCFGTEDKELITKLINVGEW